MIWYLLHQRGEGMPKPFDRHRAGRFSLSEPLCSITIILFYVSPVRGHSFFRTLVQDFQQWLITGVHRSNSAKVPGNFNACMLSEI